MALGSQVIDLIGLDALYYPDQAGAVGEITIVQLEVAIVYVRILVEVIDSICVKQRRTTLQAMHLITLAQQKFCQVGAVLSGNACDQGYFFI